jgi:outer membrane cobalamin receptor
MEIFGRIENLFDTQYTVAAGYPAPPVNAYAGVRWRF